ncbi:hypothetical protein K0M31_009039 [Melipona bicolor]|uniref:Chitin-binding type-2 domain-containing protein n=1 Tax=Melipona bicolor TaxID=60889 RepID=A0AA40FPL6_9HYME|nr:hypothetical protein K0M31_009039 [Melipona bicolor]
MSRMWANSYVISVLFVIGTSANLLNEMDRVLKPPKNSADVLQKHGEINFKCMESGFFAEPDSCKRFYNCSTLLGVHYLANIFDCLDDRVYSINQKKCVHQRNNDRPECSVQTQSQLVPQLKFIKEPRQPQLERKQEPLYSEGIEDYMRNLLQETMKLVTNSENDAVTTVDDTGTTESYVAESVNLDDDSHTTDSYKIVSTNSVDNTDTTDSYEIESTNSNDDSDTKNLYEEINSTDAYVSVINKIIRGKAPELFENVKKDDDSFTYVTARENENTTLSIASYEKNIVEQICVEEGFLPDLEDCSKFYRCVVVGSILNKYEFSCPAGTFWDNWRQTCNFPRQVQNLRTCKRWNDFGIAAPVQFSMPRIEDSAIISDLSKDRFAIVCPSGFQRHLKYCNLFHQCIVNNDMQRTIVLFGCPNGAIFDEERLLCTDATLNCTKFEFDEQSSSIVILNRLNEVLCPEEGQFPYSKFCSSKYFKCVRNEYGILEGYLVDCPAGNVYSLLSNYCVPPTLFPHCTNYYQV